MPFPLTRLLLLLSTIAFGVAGRAPAEPLQELPLAGIGFIGPVPGGNPPQTTPCRKFGYHASVGFPYLNRSIVLDLGKPALVHMVALFDDLSDHGGSSPSVAESGLNIYTSMDDRSYQRYTPEFQMHFRAGDKDGIFDVVELRGLALFARYIKLHTDRDSERWDLGCNDLQTMARAYHAPELATRITRITLPRYAAVSLLVRAQVEMPSAQDVQPLTLNVKDATGRSLANCRVAVDGSLEQTVDIRTLPPGPHSLAAKLLTRTGTTLASADARFYCCPQLDADPAPGSAPMRQSGAVVMLADLPQRAQQPDAQGWHARTFRRQGDPAVQSLLEAQNDASPLAVPLPAKGWYAISIGLADGCPAIEARLGDEGDFRPCSLQVWRQHDKPDGLGEAFVECAQLHDTTLWLRPVRGKPCRVAFIKLLALSDEQTALTPGKRHADDAGRVIVNNDGFSMFFSGVNTVERLRGAVDQYAGKRLFSFDWCLGSDASCTYDTKVGSVFGADLDTFWRKGDKKAHDCITGLIAQGHDPLRVIIDRCRSRNIRVNISFRANANYPDPMARTFNGKLYWQHEGTCRITSRQGRKSYRLSYAFPQVMAFRLAIIEEGLTYGPDGVHLDFLRHPPFVGYDEPMIKTFQQRHGVNPREVTEDERWIELCAEVMTKFVREVRKLVDQASTAQNKQMTLSTSFDYLSYRQQGLDVAQWVKEGLVDNISPGVHGHGGRYFPIAEFAAMVRGTDCELFPRLEHTIRGHDPTPESERGEITYEREHMTLNLYRARALELYAEGADGVYLFNTSGLESINPLSDLACLRAWNEFERPLVGWLDPIEMEGH